MTGGITALIVAIEIATGATARRDLVGLLAKGWMISCLPPALVAPDHSLWQVFVAATGVLVAIATVGRWIQDQRQLPPPPPTTASNTRDLSDRARADVRSRTPKVPHHSPS